MTDFTHLNKNGEALMVDVGEKDITRRTARAFAKVKMKKETLQKLLNSELKKGDGLATARIAGWCSHRMEELISGGKIIRPAYKNIAFAKKYVPMEERIENYTQISDYIPSDQRVYNMDKED